jgi:hypothetical protein
MSAAPVTESYGKTQPADDTAPVSITLTDIRKNFSGGSPTKMYFDVALEIHGVSLRSTALP